MEHEYLVRAHCPYTPTLYYMRPFVWTAEADKAKRFTSRDEADGVALASYDHWEYGTSVEEA